MQAEMSHYRNMPAPSARFEAVGGTLWRRKGIVLGDLLVGLAAAQSDALQTNGFLTFLASAVIVEFARADFVNKAINPVIGERSTKPLHDGRTIFAAIRDAWREKTIQYTPRQKAREEKRRERRS